MDIYSKAKKRVYLIDNYINIKTLRLLQSVKPGVEVTAFQSLEESNKKECEKSQRAVSLTKKKETCACCCQYIF